ncbi:MAG: tRNA-dihydrouridine synthase [Patescibacteria group bacterium]
MGFSFSALKKPFLTLAPMEEVADTVFRRVVTSVAKPDVMFTEFTNVEGIVSQAMQAKQARQAIQANPVLQRLVFSETERPIVAQIWGKDPKNFYEATKLIKKLRFDGVDINMGCPEKDVVKNGCCIALINNRNLAAEIIAAVKEGARSAGWRMPVSVKTRIGLDKIATEDWCGFLLEQKIDALTVHGRTAKEKSDVPAHWDEIAKAVKLRDQISPKTIIIGNGDVKNFLDAKCKLQIADVDGVMIGRGVLENMACFSPQLTTLSPKENINLLREHLERWEKTWGKTKNFAIMKKFVKAYIKGWEGAGELRARLFETNSLKEMEVILET